MITIIEIIVKIALLIGWAAGQIFLISSFISIVKISNRILNFVSRFFYVIFALLFLNIPILIIAYATYCHDFIGYYEFAGIQKALDVVVVIVCLSISFYGIYQLSSDWHRKYNQIKNARA